MTAADDALDRLWFVSASHHTGLSNRLTKGLIGDSPEAHRLIATVRDALEQAIDPEDYKTMEGFWLAARERADAAEAEVQRLTEGLRRIDNWPVDVMVGPATDLRRIKDYARALLAASPPDGGGPRYDREAHAWVGQCPHGDMCSGCDARGYCTREEPGGGGAK